MCHSLECLDGGTHSSSASVHERQFGAVTCCGSIPCDFLMIFRCKYQAGNVHILSGITGKGSHTCAVIGCFFGQASVYPQMLSV